MGTLRLTNSNSSPVGSTMFGVLIAIGHSYLRAKSQRSISNRFGDMEVENSNSFQWEKSTMRRFDVRKQLEGDACRLRAESAHTGPGSLAEDGHQVARGGLTSSKEVRRRHPRHRAAEVPPSPRRQRRLRHNSVQGQTVRGR